MLQPGPGSVGEEKGEVADDEVVVVRPSQLACQPIVCKPQLWPCLPRVLGDGSRGSESGRKQRSSYSPAEDSRTWWLERGTSILLAVVTSPAWGGSLGAPFPRGELDGRGGADCHRGDPGPQASRPVCAQCGLRPPTCVGRALRDAPRGLLASERQSSRLVGQPGGP
jgi:hypothetical protein